MHTFVQETPDDVLTMPESDRFELATRKTGVWSSYVAGQIFGLFNNFCRANRRGWTFPAGATYQCFTGNPAKIRRLDASYIRLDRLPSRELPKEYLPIAPDLAVQVISPFDLSEELELLVDDLFRAGVLLVWVINPTIRTVRIRRPNGNDTTLRENGEISGEDVLADFRCTVRELFLPPDQS